MTDTFEKVSYISIEDQSKLSWYEWFFGKSNDEIEADQKAKEAKYLVTEQIKRSADSHALMKMKKHQSDTSFDHTQSVVKTGQKMQDNSNSLPSPYQPPQVPIKKTLHPSIAQLRNKRFKTAKDDIDI
jgi:hypothetical protein